MKPRGNKSRASVQIFFAFVVAWAVLPPHLSYATHFRFGHLTWIARPDLGPNVAEFTLINAFRRDGYDGSGDDGHPIIGDTFEEHIGNTSLFFGDGQRTPTFDYEVIGFDVEENWVIARALPPTGEELVHIYNSKGPFVARIDSCCRITDARHINNNSNSYRVEAMVDFRNNNTGNPLSLLPPIIDCPQDAPCMFQIIAVDPDGEGVTYRLSNTGSESKLSNQPGPPFAPNRATVVTSDCGGTPCATYAWDTTGARLNPNGETLYSTQVKIEEPNGVESAIDFFIRIAVFPSCTLEPSTATPGETVTLQAINLPPGETAEIFLDSEFQVDGPVDASGSVRVSFSLPEDLEPGLRLVEVRMLTSDTTANCPLFIADDETQGRCSVVPASPRLGERVQVRITGLLPLERVEILLGSERLGTRTLDESGADTANLVVPEDAALGLNLITVAVLGTDVRISCPVVVRDNEPQTPAKSAPRFNSPPSPPQGRTFHVLVGETARFVVQASDRDLNDGVIDFQRRGLEEGTFIEAAFPGPNIQVPGSVRISGANPQIPGKKRGHYL